VWLTARRRALGLGLALLAGIAVFATNSAPGHLSIPWNPFFAFIPTIVLAVAAWRCALGDRWSLPLAAGLATWSVGAHIAYAPTVVGLSAVAIVGITVTTAHRHGRAGLRGLIAPAVWSVALVATLSSPALLDLALHGTRSNPWRIVHWLRHPDGPTIPTRDALKAFLGDLSGRATWATGKRAVYPFLPSPPTQFPVLLVPGAAALVLAVIRRAVDEIVSFVVVGVALLTTLLGLLHLQSQRLVDWYLLPLHAMALVYAAVTAWSLCRSVSHVVRPRLAVLCGLDPRWVAGAGTALATLLAVVIVPNLHEEATTRDMHRAPQALVQAVERQVPRSHTILLDAPYQSDGYYSESLALELERAGYTVRYPPRYAYLFSEELTTLPTGRPVTVLSPTLSKSPPAPPASGAVALGTAPPGTKGLPRGYGYTVWRLS
jgi:hypothetical protein